MMTQTHLLIGPALLARPRAPARNAATLSGALLPDAAMLVFFGAALFRQTPQATLWDVHYWQSGWQQVFASFNSLPL